MWRLEAGCLQDKQATPKHRAIVIAVLLHAIAPCIAAQSVSTASVRGVVRGERGEVLAGAQVLLVNRATGHRVDVELRGSRFDVAGLEVGGPYSIIVRKLGYEPSSRDSLFLALGEPLQMDVVLAPVARQLDALTVRAQGTELSSGARIGIGTRVEESSLRLLPSLNRDLYDFVQLTPEVSVRSGLLSGGGSSPRYNNFLIDGVSQRHLQGSLPTGGFNGGKSLSMEAVREYEVILSAFDVRYGDFAGAMINAVTRRGTNDPFATAFAYGRNERLAQTSPFLRGSPYERLQYGFAVGGPIVRDRVHFMLAPEFQRLSAPASGPYLGQEIAGRAPAPVAAEDVDRFIAILTRYGIAGGTAARVNVQSPLANVFGRVDFLLPALGSRAVLWHNYSRLSADRFERAASNVFPLSSFGWTQEIVAHATAVQLLTTLRNGALNELVVARTHNPQRSVPWARHPLIVVTVPATGANGGQVALQAGTREIAQGGGEQGQSSLEVADHFSVAWGTSHRVAVGGRAELFALRAPGVIGSYGRWEFLNLDSLDSGGARIYTVSSGAGGATLRGAQYGAYAGDEWHPSARLAFTLGVRADAMVIESRPPYNAAIDAIYQRRTDAMPRPRVALSPRAGFSWDPKGDEDGRLRGGMGIFTVRPPLAWLHAAMYNYGEAATLSCGPRPTDRGAPPAFEPAYRLAPLACANAATSTEGSVHLLDRDLKLLARTFRASLAYDRALPWGLAGTLEGLYSRSIDDFLFVNLKLAGPQSVDRFGRVLYGTIARGGTATPATVAPRATELLDIDVRNQARNHAYQLAARLTKRGNRLSFAAGYAFSRVRDVQSLAAAFPPANNWHSRALSGGHESLAAGISAFEVRHRVVLAATASAPWRRGTDFSLYYVGESGAPFTYVATGVQGRGDLNADGSSVNDPIYVPRTASDPSEILFSGLPLTAGGDTSAAARAARVADQQAAFERFIASSDCLRRQRGRIVERNSCRGPWVNTMNAAVRQSLPGGAGHTLAIQLELFNVLNLLNRGWGQYRQPVSGVLQHVADGSTQSQPAFQFNSATKRYTADNIESGYQLQLALRYSY